MTFESGPRPRRTIQITPVGLALAAGYLVLFALYAWQASRRSTITIFSDEIELAQLSRSIAETGEAGLRAGAPARAFAGLSSYLMAPWWWIDDVGTAYAAIKVMGAAVMTAVVFPAYLLARLVLSSSWAVAAALAAAATPALAYAPFLVEEPLAYPAATLAFFLTTRALVRPSLVSWAAALAAAGAAWLVRAQLAVLFFLLALAALYLAWDSGRVRRWRTTWTRADRLGAAVLALGGVILVNAVISHNSFSWYTTTATLKDRLFDFTVWAAGAFAIGVGLLPVIAGLAVLARRPSRLTREERAFAVVAASAIVVFVFYAGVKAAYLSTVFADLIAERNLIYLAPLLMIGSAVALSKRDAPVWATVAAGAIVLYLVVAAKLSLANYPNYEAHGLAIAAFANRILRWPEATIEDALVALVVVAVALLVALRLLRSAPFARALACGVGAVVLAWSLTTEIYAAHGEQLASESEYSALPKPADWLDRTIGPDGTALFLGQQLGNPNLLNQLEFWNRSLKEMWSLDATAPGPGWVTTPDLGAPDGTLDTLPRYDERYVVAGPGVDLAGRPVGEPVGTFRLHETDPDGRIRLASAQAGVYPDGWMSNRAVFSHYDVEPGSAMLARITLSREAWCGEDVPGHITIRLGPIGVDEQRQAYITRVSARARGTIHRCQSKVFVLRPPPEPWRAEVEITPTFSPRELDPAQGDARQLGARVDFRTIPLHG